MHTRMHTHACTHTRTHARTHTHKDAHIHRVVCHCLNTCDATSIAKEVLSAYSPLASPVINHTEISLTTPDSYKA